MFILSIPYSTTLAKECKQGFSSFWEFDQKKKNINLKEIFPLKICTFIKNQLNANFKFILKKNNKVVFSNKIYWNKKKIYEGSDEKGNMFGTSEEGIDYMGLKFPVLPKDVDSYEVLEIDSGKSFGKGEVKLRK